VCITLNEYPYVRYYMPSHHPPLGPLKPHETTRAAPAPAEGTARWRTNLARGDQARTYEAADSEYVSRLLALQVQGVLDEHKKANPDFPVRALRPLPLHSPCALFGAELMPRGHMGRRKTAARVAL
jgi:syntaxin-binding protein 1